MIMAPPPMTSLLLLPLLLSSSLMVSGGTVGVMYRVDIPGVPPPNKVVPAMIKAGITRVRLVNGDASSIESFVGSGIDINLSLEDPYLIPIFSANVSRAMSWVNLTISPTHPQGGVTSISLGFGIFTNFPEYSQLLLPAMRNLNYALGNLSLAGITVTTAHAFKLLTTPFPPSLSEFNASAVHYVKPLLDYCNETGAPFLINIFPFEIYRSKVIKDMSTSFVMFEAWDDDYLVDPVTMLSYSNLYSVMIDSAVMALEKLNYSDMPIVAIGTGWPSDGNKMTEPEANRLFAAEYNERLISLLAMKLGTPLRRGVSPETYIYALFDEPKMQGVQSYQNNWGIWRNDLSVKYALDFNPNVGNGIRRTVAGGVIKLCFLPLLLILLMITG